MYYLIFNNENIAIGATECLTENAYECTYEQFVSFNNGTPYGYIDNQIQDISDTPEYITEELAKAKEAKMQENATKRDEHLLAGVVYKDVLFDSDTDQKINLQFYVPNMSDTDTVIWFGKDNQPLECTREDLMAIGGLISSLTVQVWSVKNPAYVEAINNATTMEELNAINIDYN